MELKKLAAEYRESADKCRVRAQNLRVMLKSGRCRQQETLLLRRRINILTEMAGDAYAIAAYLDNYYSGGGEKYAKRRAHG